MKYVYILENLDSQHFYVGITEDLRAVAEAQRGRGPPHIKIRALEDQDLRRV